MGSYEELSDSEKKEFEACIKTVEEEVAEIRKKALEEVRKTNPEIDHVVDKYTIDDYWAQNWDYPGRWYFFSVRPRGIGNDEDLIDSIVKETLAHFTKKQ